jgi:hypothetical protein
MTRFSEPCSVKPVQKQFLAKAFRGPVVRLGANLVSLKNKILEKKLRCRMPRFTQDNDIFFRKTMIPRVPEYFFTPEDVELITKETGIDENMIQHWARSLRCKMGKNLLGTGVASIQEYLQASAESLAEKVFLS